MTGTAAKFFYWNACFETGVAEIDLQHQRLIDLVNDLASAIADGERLPEIQTIFGWLMDYATVHFRDEERLMDASDLSPDEIFRHKAAHRGFLKAAYNMSQGDNLVRAEMAAEILEFLITWLISHILKMDTRICGNKSDGAEGGGNRLLDASPIERVLIGALTETERRFRLISDHSPAMIWVTDALGQRGFVNRALTDFIGVNENRILDVDWAEFIHPDDRLAHEELLAAIAVNPEPAEAEYRLKQQDGSFAWVLERIMPRVSSYGEFLGLIASVSDITLIKQAEQLMAQSNRDLEIEVARRTRQLEELMLTDPLTGIGNRRELDVRLEEEILRAQRYGRPLSLVFFDIDHFKAINDTFGHRVGDEVLVQVAQALKVGLRDCDILGRFGGEEFLVLLIETDLDQALAFADRQRETIAKLIFSSGPKSITISAGVAQWHASDTTSGLIERADQALYTAKAAGRNRCNTDPLLAPVRAENASPSPKRDMMD